MIVKVKVCRCDGEVIKWASLHDLGGA